jgi:hypothetical protein
MGLLLLNINDAKEFVLQWPALLEATILIMIVTYVGYSVYNRPPKLNVPVVGEPGSQVGRKEILEGARKVGETRGRTRNS